MSYTKNCVKCGEKISLREMSHGQWVAFDAGTDTPHKHGKRTRKRTNSSKTQPGALNINESNSIEPTSNASKIIIAIIAIILVAYFLN